MKFIKTLAAGAIFTVMAGAASAAVIDFGGLSGSSGDALGTYMEDGFTVTDTSGTWNEAHVFGNPTPAIFTDGAGVNTIDVSVTGGGTFKFLASDIGCGVGGNNDCQLRAVGMLGASTVFDFSSATFAPDANWHTIASLSAGIIDKLTLTQYAADSNIDNIGVELSAIPVPAAGLLLVAGLGGLVSLRRRKTK